MERSRYHHGTLPDALLKATALLVLESGVAGLSLREVARRAGVSHGAPAHHFGDKAGLLTALATQGYELFTRSQCEARDGAGSEPLRRFAATGYAYVMFADTHRAHFEIMFRPELLRQDDPALLAASNAAYDVLRGVVAEVQAAGFIPGRDPETVAIIAWSQAHGLATLWLSGNLRRYDQHFPDFASIARAVFLPGGLELK
ncbi:MAG TPA: TetR/AcrR family transcriptional regulator [Polyangiales bacterium]|nr:TetR/AcrR family transcriptional regulator [Polyangiales bacterium]